MTTVRPTAAAAKYMENSHEGPASTTTIDLFEHSELEPNEESGGLKDFDEDIGVFITTGSFHHGGKHQVMQLHR